jgi:hypothetical protein
VSANSGQNLNAFVTPDQVTQTVIGTRLIKGPLLLPQTATSTLFTVSGGAILVTELVGYVNTVLGATACNLSVGTAPTAGTPETGGIGSATAVASTAAGKFISAPAGIGVNGMALGTWTLGGTGVAFSNPYNGTVQAVISGGSGITNVSVNGVTVGAAAGTYQVPAHGTLSVAYSTIPTVTVTSSGLLTVGWGGSVSIGKEHIVSPGTITWTTSASIVGAVTWYMNYIPLDTWLGEPAPGLGQVV